MRVTRTSRQWTPADKAYLVKNHDKPSEVIGAYLGRTASAVDTKRQELGLLRGQPRKDTAALRKRIRELWGEVPSQDIALELDVSRFTVDAIASRMGLGKNAANGRKGHPGKEKPYVNGWPRVTGPTPEAVSWAEVRARALRNAEVPERNWPMEVRLILGMRDEFRRKRDNREEDQCAA